jgi:hypothetical protein
MFRMTLKRASGATKLTLEQLNERLKKLERLQAARSPFSQWWLDQSGRFQNDPMFDEIVSLGRKQRRGLSRGKKRAGSRH